MDKYLLVAVALTVSLSQVGHCGVVKQWERRIAPKEIVFLEQHKVFTCSGDDGYYASPGECTNVYYYCQNGLAKAQTCTEGDVFDPVTFVCTTSSQASCNKKFDCPSDGIFPNPGKTNNEVILRSLRDGDDACSNMYYVCSGGQLYVEYCPEDFVFDPILLKCVPKESASCSPTTTELPSTVSESPTTESESPSATETEAPTTETEAPVTETETAATILEAPMLKAYIKMTTSTEFTCPSDQHGLYANTCTTYYECTGGVPYLRNCPKCIGIRSLESVCGHVYDNHPCYSGNTCH